MDLDTHMMGNEADDPFGIGRRDSGAGILEAAGKPVDPQPAVRIEHDLDDAGIFEVSGDQRAERGAQHARASGDGFRSEGGDRRHIAPHIVASRSRRWALLRDANRQGRNNVERLIGLPDRKTGERIDRYEPPASGALFGSAAMSFTTSSARVRPRASRRPSASTNPSYRSRPFV